MKKMFKKSIACLIAVLMVVSTMPFAALAADTRDGSSLGSITLTKFAPDPVINTDVANTNNNYKNLKGTYYNSVLYMKQFTGSDYHDITTDNKTGSIYHSKNTVVMDDGTSDMLVPVMMREPGRFFWAGSNTWCFTSLYPCAAQNNTADSTEFGLKDYWYGGQGVGNLDWYYALTYSDGKNKKVGHNSTTKSDGENVGNKPVINGDYTPYYGNALVIKRQSNYGAYKKYTNIYWYLNARANNSVKTASITDNDSAIYVVNYAPMATQLDTIQAEYNGYKNSGKTYTADSLTAYENAVKAIADFNLGSYDFSTDTEAKVQSCGNTIASIMETYNNTAKPVEYKGPHAHTMSEWAVETAGTCTVKTVEERHCTDPDCDDANLAKETRETTVVANNHTALAANWTATIGGTNHYKQCSACTNYVYEDCNSNTKVDGYAETCTVDGLTDGYNCSGCGRVMTAQQTINAKNHAYGAYTTDAAAKTHTKVCANDASHVVTENCNIENGTCTVCDYVYVDFTAYDAALAAVKTNDTNEYTEASFTAYTNAVNAAKIDKATATQAQADAAVTAIEEATALLRNANVTVTFVVFDEDGEEVKTDIVNAVYGQKVSLDADGTVKKWTITDTRGIDTLLERADSTIEILATKDQTVNAFLKEEDQKDAEKEYAKINFYGKNGVLFDVKYIEKTVYSADVVIAQTGVSAPAVSFYTFDSWTLNAIRYGATDEIDMYANYKANEDTARCTIHFGGQERSYAYDSYVYLSSWAAWNADANLALSKTPNQSGILTYIDGKAFYAPHASDIYVIEVAAKQDSTAITGSYSLADKSMGTGAVFNAKFYATDMSKVQEFGVVVINPVTGAEKVVKADMASENNEYSVRVDLPATTSLTSLKAKSYVIIDGVTLYSSVATQAL